MRSGAATRRLVGGRHSAAALALLASSCLALFDRDDYVGQATGGGSGGGVATTGGAGGDDGQGGGGGPLLAPCDGGKCEPFTIADQESHVTSLLIEAGEIYWTNLYHSEDVRRAPTTVKTHVVVAEGPAHPVALTKDDTHLYWASTKVSEPASAVTRIAFDGSGEPDSVTTHPDTITAIAASDSHVYFATANDHSPTLSTEHSIVRIDKVSRAEEVWASGIGRVYRMAVDGGRVLFTDATNGGLLEVTASETVNRLSPSTTTQGNNAARGLAVTPLGVYWCENVEATIMFLPRGSMSPEPLIDAQNCGVVAGDETWIYWTEGLHDDDLAQPLGLVRARRAEGGQPYLLADQIANPSALTFDHEAVYYGTYVNPDTGYNSLVIRIPVNR